ncbi:MAG: 3-dehydroquinate synthase [Chloroherpetonaceae bacterium]|nr:3-dehydroquinate synthase [Chthonomonadaceae bacterium]MDW8208595.1 3-dehydroquinate synthase [Chloroherpetonaceae bacterium]
MTLRIPVELGARSYAVEVASGLIASGQVADRIATLAGGGRVCLVTHPGLYTPYALPVEAGLRARGVTVTTLTVPPGERYKTLQTVARLYAGFVEARLDRRSLIVAVGGGVIGDVVGFAAATFLRGVPYVQVPTTLLAQVDSSVGGKTGVDLPQGKNLVGAFHQPCSVLVDPQVLRTLPRRELRAGLAEVIKYGIIYDADFLEALVADRARLLRREDAALTRAIARSCEIKASIVGQDETEQGLRAILNFGHTIGHALEAATRYRRYRHGEAVAIGMMTEVLIGFEMGVTPPEAVQTVQATLRAFELPVGFPADVPAEAILEAAQRDKKNRNGRLHIVLPRRIGEVFLCGDVTAEAIRTAIATQSQMT